MADLDFGDYQRRAARTGGAVRMAHPIVYPTLGLTNEAGEVAGKVKKIFRDRGGDITDDDREALKLEDRQRRGTLAGDGDHR
jgi:hypothetical protein